MARTSLTVTNILNSGITPAYGAANADGHYFANDGRVLLQVKNTNGSTRTVTVQTPATVGGLAVAEVAVVVPITTGDKMIGPFDPSLFNQAGGLVYVDFDAVADLTIAAFRLP